MQISTSPINIKVKFAEGETPLLPTYGTEGAGAVDLYANEDVQLTYGSPVIVRTGLHLEIPEGYAFFVYSRSGHGFKNNVRLGNCVGVIDSDFRGELMIKLTMDFPSWQETLQISRGHRIAQGVLSPVPKMTFEVVEELSYTERGNGGLGSTGV